MTRSKIRRLGGLAIHPWCTDTTAVGRGQPPRPQTPRSRKVPRRLALSEKTGSAKYRGSSYPRSRAEAWQPRLAPWQQAGVTETAYQPGGPDIPRDLAAFARVAGL